MVNVDYSFLILQLFQTLMVLTGLLECHVTIGRCIQMKNSNVKERIFPSRPKSCRSNIRAGFQRGCSCLAWKVSPPSGCSCDTLLLEDRQRCLAARYGKSLGNLQMNMSLNGLPWNQCHTRKSTVFSPAASHTEVPKHL